MSADRSQAAGTIRRKLTAAARVTETPDQAEHWAAAQEQGVEAEAESRSRKQKQKQKQECRQGPPLLTVLTLTCLSE